MTMGVSVCSIFKVCYPNNNTVTVALQKKEKMSVPYNLKEGQSRIFHELPSGLNMEVIVHKKKKKKKNESQCNSPALVFVHGSYHAAWCWAEKWLPFFSQSGYDCYALSLLAQVLFSLSLNYFFFFLIIIN